jgi:trigger factor
LKIETQPLEDHQVKLRVEADQEQLEEAKRRAARRIAKNTKIPGFRPGKAPYHIIERHIGEAAILEEAIELLVKDIYPKALEESGIQPYGPGQLEDISTEDQVTFEFIVPLRADVKLGDYKELREDYSLEPTKEEEIDKVLDHIRGQQAILEPVERPAQEGDQVQVLLTADRNEEDGEKKVLLQEMPVPVVIKPESAQDEDEWPYPGFSQQLIGKSAGEEAEFSYTYPEDSSIEALRGVETTFRVKIDNIKTRELPDVDDDFAASQGDFKNAEELRSAIRERIEARSRGEYEQGYGENLLERMVEGAEVKYPPQMLEDELDSMVHDLEHRIAQQNMDMDTYLKTRQMDMQALRDEMRPRAEERLKRMLVMMELGKQEDVQVSTEEVQAGTIQTIENLYQNMDPKQIRKQLNKEAIQNISSSVTTELLMRNTMDRLIAIGKGEGDKAPEPAEEEAPADAEPELNQAAAVEEPAGDVPDSDETKEEESVESASPEAEAVEEPEEELDEESTEQGSATAKD